MSEYLYMDKKLLKQELLEKNRQFKQMMGTFSSFEIVYDYINLIISEKYLAKKLLPLMDILEKEQENFNNLSIDLDNFSIDISSENALEEMPIFKEQHKKWQNDLNNKKTLDLMDGLPLYFTLLSDTAYSIKLIKDYQKDGNLQESQKIIEEIKEKSFSVVNMPMITGFSGQKMTYGQYLDISMELMNKFFIDEIDSELLLENSKPVSNLSYNSDDYCLHINGQQINIRLKTVAPIDAHILKTLFSDSNELGKENDFKDIAYDFDENASYDNPKDYQRYRHACDNLNKKISKQTNNKINDFIKYKTGQSGWCKINKKYL